MFEKAKEHLSKYGLDILVLELEQTSATIVLGAKDVVVT